MTRLRPWIILAALLASVVMPAAAAAEEIGPNDFRVSNMGPDGNTAYDGRSAAVAYNSIDDRYLVVWEGDSAGEREIHARLIAGDGAPIGPSFAVSDMGTDGSTAFLATVPSVAYNPNGNEFLVVWSGDDNTAPLVDNEFEIFGQRLDGTTGVPIGANDFRISDMGPNGSQLYPAEGPDVAFNPIDNRYLVIWSGVDSNGNLIDNEYEIHGQFIDGSTGAEIGVDGRVSDMGPDGNPAYDTFTPAVTYNETAEEFLVVWSGDDDTPPLVDNEFEIFGQRLGGATGTPMGANDFRISEMGPNGSASFFAGEPDVLYAPQPDEYFVVWYGDHLNDEFEIYAQRLDGPTAASLHSADARISHMGPDGSTSYLAIGPAVAYNQFQEEYFTVWYGDHIVDGELEVYGQRLDVNGSPRGEGAARLSDMGPDGNVAYGSFDPAVAHANPFLVVWTGDDDTGALVDGELEIYGQLWGSGFDSVALVNPATGFWFGPPISGFYYGNPGDYPILGDWDCDGVDTPGMYRRSDGYVYLRNSNTQGIADIRFFFGNPGDLPIAGDFDADGCDTVSIYRPAEGRFYIINQLGANEGGLGAAEVDYLFGNPGDKPFIGDFDGDGVDTVGLHRESTGFVYFRNSHTQGIADNQFFFGDPGDRLVAGDWGIVDGIDTPGLFRPSDTTFYRRFTNTQGNADLIGPGFGQADSLPVAGTFSLD